MKPSRVHHSGGLSGPIRCSIAVLLTCVMSLPAAPPVHAASFACKSARTGTERLICATPSLSKADEAVGRLYALDLSLLSGDGKAAFRSNQRAWLKTAPAACPTTDAGNCLDQVYDDRRQFLGHAVRRFDGLTIFYLEQVLVVPGPTDRLLCTATFPQIERPPNGGWALWNRRQVMSPDLASSCDDGAGQTAKQVEITFASSTFVGLTRSSSFHCTGTPHGYDTATNEFQSLLPSPHALAAADLFRSGSGWQDFLTRRVNDDVQLEVRRIGLDPGGATVADNRATAINPKAWRFSQDGLTIGFQEYQIDLGRAFAPQIHLGWVELAPYLKPGLRVPPTH